MTILIILAALLLLYLVWQAAELSKFRTTEYVLHTDKVQKELRLAVISDLHSFTYGEDNKRLLAAITEAAPDLILIPGDLIVTERTRLYETSAVFAEALTKICPVFFSYGNHEDRARATVPEFAAFRERLTKAGVVFLDNTFSTEPVHGTDLTIFGLTIPLACYKKGTLVPLPADFLKAHLGPLPEEGISILLAHDPVYAEDYFSYGAFLTLSGHNHGGLVCLPNGRSIISPRFHFFPPYDQGHFERDGHHLIISRGLGTHTYHIRIFNRAELVLVRILP